MTTYATNFEVAKNAPVVHPFDWQKFAATNRVKNVTESQKTQSQWLLDDEDEAVRRE